MIDEPFLVGDGQAIYLSMAIAATGLSLKRL